VNEQGEIGGSDINEDDGPLDSYMHAQTDLLFDDNGDIIVEDLTPNTDPAWCFISIHELS